ncbi:MAG: WD40 repeat domain-containing serine/threonine-protein kinase [Pirellulaceae bacterium]
MNDFTDRSADDDYRLSELAHEFTQQLRRGESPSIDDYVARIPELAREIRELFSTLLFVESPGSASAAHVARAHTATWQLGEKDQLGDYRVLRELGRGGMGVVYEAVQDPLARRVALKVLPKSLVGDRRQLDRFRREAQVMASLRHPNIVPVFAVGETEDLYYYAMQLIDGQPLRASSDDSSNAALRYDATKSRVNFYRQVALVGKQVADALAHAHEAGVIHRDIKPSNLLIDDRGNVWISDFGVALVEGHVELTATGDVVGTLRYMPPERFEGHVDQRGDVYSLGVTLYELLTARPAFDGSTRARLVDQILNTIPTAPTRIDPRIPRDLETIIRKAMAPEAAQRYPRASALADELDRFLSGRPILARHIRVWDHVWRWCRRNKVSATLMGIAGSLLSALLVISVIHSARVHVLLNQTQQTQRESRAQLFHSLIAQAHARWMGGHRIGRRFETLRVIRQAASLAQDLNLPESEVSPLRNEAIAAISLPDVEYGRILDAFPPGTSAICFNANLGRYARGNPNGSVTIHRDTDHRELVQIPSPSPQTQFDPWDVVFSPDGKYVMQRGSGQQGERLRMWDVSNKDPRLTFELMQPVLGVTSFTSDSAHLGVILRRSEEGGDTKRRLGNEIHILNVETGRDASTPIDSGLTWRVVFHPSQPIVAVQKATGIHLIRWDNGEEVSQWKRTGATPIAWRPDGSELVAVDEHGPQVFRWDVARQTEKTPLVRPTSDGVDQVVFNHRGDRLVVFERFRYQLFEIPSGLLIWDGPEAGQGRSHFGADDQLLACFGGGYPRVRLLHHADRLELRRVPLDSMTENGFPRALVSLDGRLIAATAKKGTVIMDAETFEELSVIPGVRIPLAFLEDNSLVTHADAMEGVSRWPIHHDQSGLPTITLGAAQSLREPSKDGHSQPTFFRGLGNWAASRDGRVIATPWQSGISKGGAHVFLRDESDGTIYHDLELGPQFDVRHTSVSPDGKYVATGSISWRVNRDILPDTITVWDSVTGSRVIDLWQGEGAPQFSPDGNWLAVSSSTFPESVRVWRVGTWQPMPTPGPVEGSGIAAIAFDPTSRLMAVQGHRIRLLVPETGKEVAYLSVAEETSLAPQCFAPDGSRLIAMGVHNGMLYVWDLRAIRHQLDELGLNWSDPPASPSRARL